MSIDSDNSNDESQSELDAADEHSTPLATPDVEVDKKINPYLVSNREWVQSWLSYQPLIHTIVANGFS